MKNYLNNEHAERKEIQLSTHSGAKRNLMRSNFSFSKNGLSTADIAKKKLAKTILRTSTVIPKWPIIDNTESGKDSGQSKAKRSITPSANRVVSQDLLPLLSGYTQHYINNHNGELPFLFQGINLANLAGFTVRSGEYRKVQANTFFFGDQPMASTFLTLNEDGSVDFLSDVNVQQGDSGLTDMNAVNIHNSSNGFSPQVELYLSEQDNYNYIINYLNRFGYSTGVSAIGSVVLDALLLCLFTTPYLSAVPVASFDTQPGGAGTPHIVDTIVAYLYSIVITDIVNHLDTSRLEGNSFAMPIDDVVSLIFTWFANATNSGAAEINTIIPQNSGTVVSTIIAEDPIFRITGLKLMIPSDMLNTRKENRNVINAVYKSAILPGTRVTTINDQRYAVLREESTDVSGVYGLLDDDDRLTVYFDCLLDFSEVEYDSTHNFYYRSFTNYELMQMHVVGLEIVKMIEIQNLLQSPSLAIDHIYSCNSDSTIYDSTGADIFISTDLWTIYSAPDASGRNRWTVNQYNIGMARYADGDGPDNSGNSYGLVNGYNPFQSRGACYLVPTVMGAPVAVSDPFAIRFSNQNKIGFNINQRPPADGDVIIRVSAEFNTDEVSDQDVQHSIIDALSVGFVSPEKTVDGYTLTTYDDSNDTLVTLSDIDHASSIEFREYQSEVDGNHKKVAWEVVISSSDIYSLLSDSTFDSTNWQFFIQWQARRVDGVYCQEDVAIYINGYDCTIKSAAAITPELLSQSAKADFSFDDRMYIGRVENPYGLICCRFIQTVSESSKQYAAKLATNRYVGIISSVAFRALSAAEFTTRDLARLLCFIQDQEEELTPEKIEQYSQLTKVGLATESSILRDLLVASKQTRTSRLSNIISALDEALFNRKLPRQRTTTPKTLEELAVVEVWEKDQHPEIRYDFQVRLKVPKSQHNAFNLRIWMEPTPEAGSRRGYHLIYNGYGGWCCDLDCDDDWWEGPRYWCLDHEDQYFYYFVFDVYYLYEGEHFHQIEGEENFLREHYSLDDLWGGLVEYDYPTPNFNGPDREGYEGALFNGYLFNTEEVETEVTFLLKPTNGQWEQDGNVAQISDLTLPSWLRSVYKLYEDCEITDNNKFTVCANDTINYNDFNAIKNFVSENANSWGLALFNYKYYLFFHLESSNVQAFTGLKNYFNNQDRGWKSTDLIHTFFYFDAEGNPVPRPHFDSNVSSSGRTLVRSESNESSDEEDVPDADEIDSVRDQLVEVDDMYAQDNPDLAASIVTDQSGKKFISLGTLFQYGTLRNTALDKSLFSNATKNWLENTYGRTWDTVPLTDIIDSYCTLSDQYDNLTDNEKVVFEDLKMATTTIRSQLQNEYCTLAVDSFAFSLEDAIDALDDTITEYNEGIESVINDKIDSITSQFTSFEDAFSSKTENIKDAAFAIQQEASDRASSLVTTFKSKAAQIASDAKSFYQKKIQDLKDDADSANLSFSLDSLLSKVRSYAGNLQDFLGDAIGLSALSNTNSGWQDSASFTNTSTITAICGVAQTGLMAAISTCFTLIGKVGSALASNVKKFMYSTFKDGVSYRIRKSGYNTVGLQAATLVVDRSQFAREFPWIYDSLAGQITGDNSYYNVCQIGPLLMFIQDYDVDRYIITVNPILIPTNDYIGTKNDYFLSESMAHSIIYSMNFYNKLVDFIHEIKPSYALFKVEVPALSNVLGDILSKAQAVSSARAWGLKALILGIGIAAGAILCATGYGSAIGIGLIAAAVVVGECCTPEPVDQDKVTRLKKDSAYANSVVTAADLASIWTSHLSANIIDGLLFIREKLSNIRVRTIVNGVERSTYGSLVHNGTGVTIDPTLYLDGELDQEYLADNDKYHFLSFIPSINYSGAPSFRVMLITDRERFFRQGAQLLAFSVLVGTATVKAAKAGIQHHKMKKLNKLAAKSWSIDNPSPDNFSSYQKDADGNIVRDEAGNPVMTVDKKAYAAAKAKYNKAQYKISKKSNRISNSLSSTSTEGLFSKFKSMVSDPSITDVEDSSVDYLVKRLG